MRALLALLPLLATLAAFAGPSDAPVAFVQAAIARHQLVFLGDVHPLAEPKEIVRQVIARQGAGAAIDLLALEVAADQQPAIDRYLASVPEDTTLLLDNPKTLRAHWGASHEYLGIYRAVHRWNAGHPEQPVHILAADVRGWPMPMLSEGMAAGGFVNRDLWMAQTFEKVLEEHPDWRMLVFMGGYHGLKGVGGEVRVGRAHDRLDRWFAGYLADAGHEVYTIITDARQTSGRGATRVFDQLSAGASGNFAVALDTATDAIRQPMYDIEEEGYRLEFLPTRFPMRTAADAMIVLTRTSPITVLGAGP